MAQSLAPGVKQPRGIGWSNDHFAASAAHPSGYNGMLYLVSALGFLGLFFSFMLWKTERGPYAHGLEKIKPKA